MLETCTCSPIPVISSLADKPGAEYKDWVDADGRWHVIVIDGVVYKQSLIVPTQAYIDKYVVQDADSIQLNQDRQTKKDRLVELRIKRRAGTVLTESEKTELLDLLLGV